MEKTYEYWQNKESNAKLAKENYQYMETKYATEIQESVNRTVRIIEDGWYRSAIQNIYFDTKIHLVMMDTVSAIHHIATCYPKSVDSIGVLNFASFKNPGGKFMEGSMAQEESLCHHSTLYNVLSRFDDIYYEPHRQRGATNNSLYYNDMLLSPNIIFEYKEQMRVPSLSNVRNNAEIQLFQDPYLYSATVITCAAPNKKAALRYGRATEDEANMAMRSRISFVLQCASNYKIRNLILGAYGCGVFGNDPIDVARAFIFDIKYTFDGVFDNIFFAIPMGNNFDAFKSVIEESCAG